jgi:hypothetical protein
MLDFTLTPMYPILQFAYVFPQRLRSIKVPTIFGFQVHPCVVIYRIKARFNNWVPGFPRRVVPRPLLAPVTSVFHGGYAAGLAGVFVQGGFFCVGVFGC